MVLILCQFHIVKTMVLHYGGCIYHRSPVQKYISRNLHNGVISEMLFYKDFNELQMVRNFFFFKDGSIINEA